MNRSEHLLTCLSEECAEVAQRVSKALRFGLKEVQSGQPLSNEGRIIDELLDLAAVVRILQDEGVITRFTLTEEDIELKRAKIERYMSISVAQGVLEPTP